MRRGLATAACCLLAAPSAAAEVKQAQSVMPPGQSGFVSAPCLADSSACDPHLTDQIPLFTDFQYKSSMLGQPGAEETPKAGVRIVRDAYGVPAVYGDTEDDMWWGMGYAIAQDRLFQIEAFRRATTGTLSEIIGRAALEDDIVARRDYYTRAEREEMIESLPGDLKTRWQAYADGVNAWIGEVNSDPSKMPAEYVALGASPEPLQVHEMAAIGIFLARTTPSDDGEELANLEGFQAVGAEGVQPGVPAADTRPMGDGAQASWPVPVAARHDAQAGAARVQALVQVRERPSAARGGGLRRRALRRLARFFPSLGGSKMWAMRKLGHAWLLTGPQLGFVMPERLVEIELHSPSLDVRGTTAAGAPVIGIGHNEHVAWGVTSGLGDEDDLYAEQLVGDEGYRFRGETRAMECRDEEFTYRPPPADFLALLDFEVPDTSMGSHTERVCRTVHGPVQEVVEGDGIAYARRYAIWKREVGTIVGLDKVNRAASIEDVDAAADELTWNENLMAADDVGNIGYWNPGLMPVRSKRWDERLPFPGTGRAEWKRLLPPDDRPAGDQPEPGLARELEQPAVVRLDQRRRAREGAHDRRLPPRQVPRTRRGALLPARAELRGPHGDRSRDRHACAAAHARRAGS